MKEESQDEKDLVQISPEEAGYLLGLVNLGGAWFSGWTPILKWKPYPAGTNPEIWELLQKRHLILMPTPLTLAQGAKSQVIVPGNTFDTRPKLRSNLILLSPAGEEAGAYLQEIEETAVQKALQEAQASQEDPPAPGEDGSPPRREERGLGGEIPQNEPSRPRNGPRLLRDPQDEPQDEPGGPQIPAAQESPSSPAPGTIAPQEAQERGLPLIQVFQPTPPAAQSHFDQAQEPECHDGRRE